jgi:hypothetical protein
MIKTIGATDSQQQRVESQMQMIDKKLILVQVGDRE